VIAPGTQEAGVNLPQQIVGRRRISRDPPDVAAHPIAILLIS